MLPAAADEEKYGVTESSSALPRPLAPSLVPSAGE
jgi:hypothetical protein